ncbi:hypothetical protein Pmani_025921 [Petrolisthes manimaculis]|uniref:Uncharacterized protein n=1 Tax=Petrolisthes manimaculis TaxID=1843537 RepID=A0AAE1U0N7_9EUCA|nr:hypothetical protein Pmani_025921 [Petrolisthes manimaculis]
MVRYALRVPRYPTIPLTPTATVQNIPPNSIQYIWRKIGKEKEKMRACMISEMETPLVFYITDVTTGKAFKAKLARVDTALWLQDQGFSTHSCEME